jgi:hypothetical protein
LISPAAELVSAPSWRSPPTGLQCLCAKSQARNPHHRVQAMWHPYPARARGVGTAPLASAPAHRARQGDHRLAMCKMRKAPVGADAVRDRERHVAFLGPLRNAGGSSNGPKPRWGRFSAGAAEIVNKGGPNLPPHSAVKGFREARPLGPASHVGPRCSRPKTGALALSARLKPRQDNLACSLC